MEPFIRLFTGTGTTASAYAINGLISLFCLIWTCGVSRSNRDPIAWRGWFIFWTGTATFYLLLAASDGWRTWPMPLLGTYWWVPFIGNYVATVALLASYAMTSPNADATRSVRRDLWAAVVLVAVAVVADLVTHQCTRTSDAGPRTGWFQIVACVALARWAWRLRTRDLSKSTLLLVYALVQLPLQPAFDLMHIETSVKYDVFVGVSYGVYAVLKLGLLGAVYLATEKPPIGAPP
jgi:hypothetical protein